MKNTEAKEAINTLIHSLLEGNITRLVSLHHKLLTEVLCNDKTFIELKDVVNLTTTRQKRVFDDAVFILNEHIKLLNKKLASSNKMEAELLELRHWKYLLEASLEKKEEKIINPDLKKKISQLVQQQAEFSTRIKQILSANNINTIGDLMSYPRHELLKLRNCGKKSITEIETYFEKHELWWGMDI